MAKRVCSSRYMEKLRRIISGMACLVALAFLFVASAQAAGSREKVTIQLRWDHQYQFAGYYAAKWLGYYDEAGFDVEIRSAITPDGRILSATREVEEGRADFGVGAADILIARDQGVPLVVMASIFQQSAAEFYAKTEKKLHSPADLLALKVARNVGDLIDIELQVMLRLEGIDPGKVTPYPHAAGYRHFIDGDVDVIPGYRLTFPYVFSKLGVSVKTLRPINYGIDFYGDSLFTHQRRVQQDPWALERFRQATLRGWEYALEHPDEIIRRIVQELPRTDKSVEEDTMGFNLFQSVGVRELTLFPMVDLGQVNIQRWRRMAELMYQVGTIKNQPNMEGFLFDLDRVERQNEKRVYDFLLTTAVIAASLLVLLGIALIFYLRHHLRLKRESEEKYRQLFEMESDSLFLIDSSSGAVIEANRAATLLYGYRYEELIQLQINDLTGDADVTGTGVTAAAESIPIRYHRKKDGTIFPVEIRSAQLNLKGRDAILPAIRDISDRVRAENIVRHQAQIQSILKEIAETALLANSLKEFYQAVYNLINKVMSVENFVISFFEETTNEIVVIFYAGIAASFPDRREAGRGLIEYTLRKNKTIFVSATELCRLVEEGEVIPPLPIGWDWLGAPLVNSQGLPFGVIGLYSNENRQSFWEADVEVLTTIAAQVSLVIERKRSEDAVRSSEIRYRALTEQSSEALVLINTETRHVIEANRRFVEMFGYSLPDDAPLYFHQLSMFSKNDVDSLHSLAEWMRRGLPLEPVQYRHKNGTAVYVERAGTFVNLEERSYLLVSLRDLRQELRWQAELARDMELARQVQQELLPVLPISPLLELRTLYYPAQGVSGDSYQFEWKNEGKLLRGYLIDVSGHGVATALQTASINVLLHTAPSTLTLQEHMELVNRKASRYFMEDGFAALLGFELDFTAMELRYIGAGITQLYLNGTKITTPGIYIGLSSEPEFAMGTIPIKQGDSIFLLTDGFTDLLDQPKYTRFWSGDGNGFFDDIDALERLARNERLQDDATGICMKIRCS